MRKLAIHVGLFLAACVTTYFAGGPYFAGTLMGILLAHELGHYIVGRRRGVDISLPYFIPLPPGISLGTMGAVINMRRPISDRNALFDVGAAGPLAGLCVAIPLLVIGLKMSPLGPPQPDTVIEGNSLFYGLTKLAIFGRWLPGDGVDVNTHPMAFAAWVGLLITAVNLLPVGQLDGGHIAKAVMGEKHETFSLRLNQMLPLFAVSVGGFLALSAWRHGADLATSLRYAQSGALPWLFWAGLLWMMRRRAGVYHPDVGDEPLSPGRRKAAFGMLILWVLLFVPVPFRPVL
ncbi:MAG TPA: site-2 protease family protein [Kofleriaceae bacterium]